MVVSYIAFFYSAKLTHNPSVWNEVLRRSNHWASWVVDTRMCGNNINRYGVKGR